MSNNSLSRYIQLGVAAARAAYGDFSGVAVEAARHAPKILALICAIVVVIVILPAFMIHSLFTGSKDSPTGTFSEMAIEALEYKEDWIKVLALAQTKKSVTEDDAVSIREAGAALKDNQIQEYLEIDTNSKTNMMDLYNNNLGLLDNLLCTYAGYIMYYDEITAPASYESINMVYNPSTLMNEIMAEIKVKSGVIKKDPAKRIFEDIPIYSTYKQVLYSSNDVVNLKVDNGKVKIKYRKFGFSAYFPISKEYNAYFSSDFGNVRIHDGENASHEGTDIFAERGTPIVSIEYCTIEKIGWNSFGGWRISLKSKDGLREYYYAHMENYAPRLQRYKDLSGKVYENPDVQVKAGEVIGYVGSSGGFKSNTLPGSETGTPPHVHMQLWVKSKGWFSDHMTLINPYYSLKLLENSKFSEKLKRNIEKLGEEGL